MHVHPWQFQRHHGSEDLATVKFTHRTVSAFLFGGLTMPLEQRADAEPIEPQPATIPGLRQTERVRALLMIRTHDQRTGAFELTLTVDPSLTVRHMCQFDEEIPVLGNPLASLPNWLQRRHGCAALAAMSADEKVPL
jgi:hypothetical protein